MGVSGTGRQFSTGWGGRLPSKKVAYLSPYRNLPDAGWVWNPLPRGIGSREAVGVSWCLFNADSLESWCLFKSRAILVVVFIQCRIGRIQRTVDKSDLPTLFHGWINTGAEFAVRESTHLWPCEWWRQARCGLDLDQLPPGSPRSTVPRSLALAGSAPHWRRFQRAAGVDCARTYGRCHR